MRIRLLLFIALLTGCTAAEAPPADRPRTHPESLLWSHYDRVLVEIDHSPGYAPTALALDAFLDAVATHTQKRIVLDGPAPMEVTPDAEKRWSWQERDSLARAYSSQGGRTIATTEAAYIHVLFLHGNMEDSVHGLHAGHRIYVFPDGIRANFFVPVPDHLYERAERHTFVHELGHALGLVDCGIPAVVDHGDGDCHSANEESVMYSSTTFSTRPELLLQDKLIPYQFDADDLADLAAFRARDPYAAQRTG